MFVSESQRERGGQGRRNDYGKYFFIILILCYIIVVKSIFNLKFIFSRSENVRNALNKKLQCSFLVWPFLSIFQIFKSAASFEGLFGVF